MFLHFEFMIFSCNWKFCKLYVELFVDVELTKFMRVNMRLSLMEGLVRRHDTLL